MYIHLGEPGEGEKEMFVRGLGRKKKNYEQEAYVCVCVFM